MPWLSPVVALGTALALAVAGGAVLALVGILVAVAISARRQP